MKSLWSESFEPVQDDGVPNKIVEEQCEILRKITNGQVAARIKVYSDPILTYPSSGMTAAVRSMADMLAGEVIPLNDSQDESESPEESFRYEFFLTSPSTRNYKYRILFIQYSIPFYPVTIVLDSGIAEEMGAPKIFDCVTKEDFVKVLGQILQSNKVRQVVGSLLTIAKSKGA